MHRLFIAVVVAACSATTALAGDWGSPRGWDGYGRWNSDGYRSYSGPYVTSVYVSRPYTTSVYVTEDYPWHEYGYDDDHRYGHGYRRHYGHRHSTSRRTCVDYDYDWNAVVVFCD